MASDVTVFGIGGFPEVEAGADIGTMIADTGRVEPRDIVVIAQKIVSKAEGRMVPALTREDARAAAKREAKRIVRESENILITETPHGFVCANGGVDMSNVPDGVIALLPKDSDRSAQRIRATIEERCGAPIAVIVSDTFGRAWRIGHSNVAIGSSGIRALRTYEGQSDPAGHDLVITQIAQIDELAAAAELVMDKLDRIPVAVVRGYTWEPSEGTAQELVRPPELDLFR
jgi:coenzyme F420-0:L-glutamate ligase/coenzyme F420-1:gamma-L-glutamate ligase